MLLIFSKSSVKEASSVRNISSTTASVAALDVGSLDGFCGVVVMLVTAMLLLLLLSLLLSVSVVVMLLLLVVVVMRLPPAVEVFTLFNCGEEAIKWLSS